MREILCILTPRLLLVKAVISRSSRQTKIRILLTLLAVVAALWYATDSLFARLCRDFSPEMADRIVHGLIYLLALGVLTRGTLAAIRQLYTEPETEFLLSQPIGLGHLFYARWLERLALNFLFVLVVSSVLLLYTRYAEVAWSAFAQPLVLLAVLQQSQFLLAILLSRSTGGPLNALKFAVIIVLTGLSATLLRHSFLISVTATELVAWLTIGTGLVGSVFLIQHLFVDSFYCAREGRRSQQRAATISLHRLLGGSWPNWIDPKLRTLVAKDCILLMRQPPILQSILAVAVIVFLVMMAMASGVTNLGLICCGIGAFTIIVWVAYMFEFEKRQAQQLPLLRVYPISARQILVARFYFFLLVACCYAIITSLVGFAGSPGTSTALLLPGSLAFESAVVAFWATGILFSFWPHFEVGAYVFTVMLAVAIAIGAALPAVALLAIPAALVGFKRGISRLETMEM